MLKKEILSDFDDEYLSYFMWSSDPPILRPIPIL